MRIFSVYCDIFLFLTVWVTETLYLNRYHIRRRMNYAILLFQMLLLMYLANLASLNWSDIWGKTTNSNQ